MGKWHEVVNISKITLLIFLTLINFIIFLDRGVLASVLTTLGNPMENDIKNSSSSVVAANSTANETSYSNSTTAEQVRPGLGLSEIEQGAIGSIFMLGFMVAGPFFAYYSQVVHPLFLIALGLSIWGVSCLATGLSAAFWQICVARGFSGIGEASFVCLAPPFILDNAPKKRKTIWIAVYYSAIALGYAIGYIFGNAMNNSFGGWYWPFYFESIFVIPFILLAFFSHKDPKMIATRKHKDSEQIIPLSQQFKELAVNPIFVFITLGFTSFVFTLGALSYWAPTLIEKIYHTSTSTANNIIGGITLFSGIFGTLIGSALLDLIVKKKAHVHGLSEKKKEKIIRHAYIEYANMILTFTTLVGCICALTGTIIGEFWFFISGVAIGEFCIFLSKGPVAMALMNSVPDDLRGQANAVAIFFMHLLGDFPSPYVVGWIFELYSYESGAFFTYSWLLWSVVFWGIAWNISRFPKAKFGDIFKNFFKKSHNKGEEEIPLLNKDNA